MKIDPKHHVDCLGVSHRAQNALKDLGEGLKPNDSIYTISFLGSEELRILDDLSILSVKQFVEFDLSKVLKQKGFEQRIVGNILKAQERTKYQIKGYKKHKSSVAKRKALGFTSSSHQNASLPHRDRLASFPIVLNVQSYHNDLKRDGIILNYTLPDLFDLNECKNDILWYNFEKRCLGELSFDSNMWEKLEKQVIFPQDPMTHLLSMSIGQFLRASQSDEDLEQVIKVFESEASTVLGRTVPRKRDLLFDNISFFPNINDVYKGDHICCFRIPTDVKLLSKLGYLYLSDIIKASEKDILNEHGFSHFSLSLIRSLWDIRPWISEVLSVLQNLKEQVGKSKTFEEFLLIAMDDLPSSRSEMQRNAKVFKTFFIRSDADSVTLKEVGKKFGLTKERVRQIVRNTFNALVKSPTLRFFWYSIYNSVISSGGGIQITSLVKYLRQVFGWERVPDSELVKELISAKASLNLSMDDDVVYTRVLPCLSCEKIHDQIVLNVVKKPHGISIEALSSYLADRCKKHCEQDRIGYEMINQATIEIIVKRMLRNILVIQNDKAYTVHDWTVQFGSLKKAVETCIREIAKPMHYSEICNELHRRGRMYGVSKNSVHTTAALSNEIMLWDRGVYVHKDNISISPPIIADIENWLESEFQNDIPYLLIYRAFGRFRRECKASGIPSESALYTCLRNSESRRSNYPRYPYIYCRQKNMNYLGFSETLEQFLLDADGAIGIDEILEFFVHRLGHKRNFLLSRIRDVPYAVPVSSNSYVHISLLNLSERMLEMLIQRIHSNISDDTKLSVEDIYKENKKECNELRINSPKMLYAVLRCFCGEQFDFYHYPRIFPHYNQEREMSLIENNFPEPVNFDEEQFGEILQYVKRVVETKSHISVSKVWKDKKISCKLLGIEKPRLLYNLLISYGQHELSLPRYPSIYRKERNVQHIHSGVSDEIQRFVRNKGRPCSLFEIEQHFVDEMGYSSGIVQVAVGNERELLRYANGSVIHEETLCWDHKKHSLLLSCARVYYDRAVKAGKCYGLLQDLLECDNLPVLANEIMWTLRVRKEITCAIRAFI